MKKYAFYYTTNSDKEKERVRYYKTLEGLERYAAFINDLHHGTGYEIDENGRTIGLPVVICLP